MHPHECQPGEKDNRSNHCNILFVSKFYDPILFFTMSITYFCRQQQKYLGNDLQHHTWEK